MKKPKLKELTTISCENKDRKKVRELANKYDCNQYEIITALLKLERTFKPELNDLLVKKK